MFQLSGLSAHAARFNSSACGFAAFFGSNGVDLGGSGGHGGGEGDCGGCGILGGAGLLDVGGGTVEAEFFACCFDGGGADGDAVGVCGGIELGNGPLLQRLIVTESGGAVGAEGGQIDLQAEDLVLWEELEAAGAFGGLVFLYQALDELELSERDLSRR